jgi:hypothetical protein
VPCAGKYLRNLALHFSRIVYLSSGTVAHVSTY